MISHGKAMCIRDRCSESIRPMSLVRCFPIGVITMEDGGDLDEKIIACLLYTSSLWWGDTAIPPAHT